MGLKYFDLETLPKLYDIVWCRFPISEDPEKPGPKLRPALVRGTLMDRETMHGAVRVCYGTSKLHLDRLRGRDLIIQNVSVLRHLGLPQATRFDLTRVNRLFWCEEFFCAPPHSSSMIAGPLPQEYRDRLRQRLRRLGIIK